MMPPVAAEPSIPRSEAPRGVPFQRFALRHPFLYLFVVVVVSNLAGSIFSFLYNDHLIVRRLMDEEQTRVFWYIASPIYNVLAYPLCLSVMLALIWPLVRCRRQLQAGEAIAPAFLGACRQRVVNLPFWQVTVNLLGWLPGAIFFPWIVVRVGGDHQAAELWKHFIISFVVSALLTTVQTFFLLETFLVAVLYRDFFQDARPAEVSGVLRVSFGMRMLWLWLAIGLMPLLALWAVVPHGSMIGLATGVALVGAGSGFLVHWVVRRDIGAWIAMHAAATAEIARDNFAVRVHEQRPDEWGRLTDHFNDMAAALSRAQHLRETFGQFVSPELRDQIVERYSGLQVANQEITVLFADIRGFTRRCAGETPEHVGDLLNRFLTLAVGAIEENGGWVNKFLGDGVLALFGATRHDADHADRSVTCAREMLVRLRLLNVELSRGSLAPLVVGIGIHTGPALVGCFGATFTPREGPPRIRREFSAIGNTVNLGQRIEQMTKQLGGPILLSEATRRQLRADVPLIDHGPQPLPGSPDPVRLFQVREPAA